MLPSTWPDGPYSPAQEEVNELIRNLMDEPPGERRALEYARLLQNWAEVSRPRFVQAA